MNWIKKIKFYFKSLGPGIIIASVVLGPGSITVASKIGSEQGFAFLWVILFSAIFMVVYTSMSVRFGIASNNSILQAIAENYGRWVSVLIGLAVFLSISSFQFGNNLGVGIAMEGITGIKGAVWPFVFTGLAIILLFWAKNLYKLLEKLMMILVLIMIFAFFFNLILVKPDFSKIAYGFVPHKISLNNIEIIAALIGTTFVVPGALYQSYLVSKKGWKTEDVKKSLVDSYSGVFVLSLISILIVITSASALYPKGIVVNSAADMAMQLELLFGKFSKIIFSIGLCSAAFSSLMVNSVIGGGMLADGFGLGSSMDQKMPKIFTTVVLILGMLIAVFFKGNIIYALILAQASSILAVPLIAVGMLLILNNKKVMGKLKNKLFQNIIAVAGLIVICVMVFFMYQKLIGYLQLIN